MNKKLITVLIDIVAIAFIYFLRDISQLINFPLYLVDPMRLMIIIGIAHTNKINSYFLAILLPLFSYFIGGHPYFLKTLIIMIELLLNIYLFYYLVRRIKNAFFSMLISIIICKAVYYGLKFLLISLSLIEGSLLSTAFKYQIITIVIFSLYMQVFLKARSREPEAGSKVDLRIIL